MTTTEAKRNCGHDYDHGRIDPLLPAADDVTAAYFEQEDPFGRWQRECLVWEGSMSCEDAFHSWIAWCKANNESPSTVRKFMTMATNRGMRRGPDENGKMMIAGVSIAVRKYTVHMECTYSQRAFIQSLLDRFGYKYSLEEQQTENNSK